MEFTYRPTIFVIEDNLVYQALIAKELESISSDIYFYTKGESCLTDLDKNPSILILDYDLEGEINGLDTLQHIRKHAPQIPAILFTNHTGLHSKENMLRYGSFDFLEKCDHSFKYLKQMISRSLTIPALA
jgi:two-component system, OmpR family, response regulator